MKSHNIDVEGLKEWIDESEFLFASSSRERKKLTVAIGGSFRLYVNGNLIASYEDPEKAVEAYNDVCFPVNIFDTF